MAPPDVTFNPFAHIVNFNPKYSISPFYEHLPTHFQWAQALSSSKYRIGPLRPDKNPRKHMFLWQRDAMAYFRHRKRMPFYVLSTLGLNIGVLYAQAASVGWRPQGDGILRAIRGGLYTQFDLLDFQRFRPFHQLSLCFSRVHQVLPYTVAWNQYGQANRVDGELMSSAEIKAEKDLMKKIFTGDADCFEKKFRWYNVASRDFLPVSNCAKTNAVATESLMRGVEAVIQAKPLAECRKHFAVVEQLRYDALAKWQAGTPAPDGSFNLRFAFKALNWRERTFFYRFFAFLGRPWELGRYHEYLHYIPLIAVVHWYSWHVLIGSFGGMFEDWKLRSNPGLLAEWGTLSDNRPYEERKGEWAKILAAEKDAGVYVYRNPGWLNGFWRFFHLNAWFYWSD